MSSLRVVPDRERYHDGRGSCVCETCTFVRQTNARASEERVRRRIEQLRSHSGMGPRFARRTFATWSPVAERSSAYDAALRASTSSPAIWLWGPIDTGKTHLAAAIANTMIDGGIPTLWATGTWFLNQVRQSYERGGDLRAGQRDVVAEYAEAPALVLDDLGKERFNAWVAEKFYDLANRRYENDLPLVITSNVHPDELAALWSRADLDESMGKAIVRRLLEMAEGNVVAV